MADHVRHLIQEGHLIPAEVIERAAHVIYHTHFDGTEIAPEDAAPIAELAIWTALEALAGAEER